MANRTIQFYQVYFGRLDSGKARPFPQKAVANHLRSLPKADRLWAGEAGQGTIYAIVDTPADSDYPCLRLAKVKHDDFPELLQEDEEEFDDLPLNPGDGVCELCYAAFFDNNIVGIVKNGRGNFSSLASYLANVGMPVAFRELAPPQVRVLVRKETAQRLEKSEGLKMLDLKIDWHLASLLKERAKGTIPEYYDLFDAIEKVAAGAQVELILKAKNDKASFLPDSVVSMIRKLLGKNEVTNFDTLKVKSVSKEFGSDIVDLLGENFAQKKNIENKSSTSKCLKPDSAYNAIKAVYQDLKGDLETAASLDPV